MADYLEAIVALVVGILMVVSIPELKAYFDQLIGAIVSAITLGIGVAVVIFLVWIVMEKLR